MLLGGEMLQVVAVCQNEKKCLTSNVEGRPNDQTLLEKQNMWCDVFEKVQKHFFARRTKKCWTSNVFRPGQTVKRFA